MSPFLLLVLVVAVFYVIDVGWVVAPNAVVFSGLRRQLRLRLASRAGFGILGRLVFVPASWLPLGRAYVCALPPLVFDEEGLRLEPEYTLPPEPPPATGPLIPYHSIRDVTVDGVVLIIDGVHRCRCVSRAQAHVLADAIRSAAAKPVGPIRDRLRRDALDVRQLEAEVARYGARTAALRYAATLMFAYVFVVLPVIWIEDLPVSLLALGLGYLLLLASVQLTYWIAHSRLCPERRWERWGRVLAMLVSPADAMASPHALSRDALARFHPLAAAAVLASRAQLVQLAESTLRALRHPEPSRATTAALRERLEQLLRAQGVEPTSLGLPPAAEEGCVAYCPRCLEQLTQRVETCPSCPSVATLRL